MIWNQDLLLRDCVPLERLRPVLAAAFSVRPDEIFIVGDITEIERAAPVIVQQTPLEGDFRLQLEPFVAPEVPKDAMWSIAELAAALQTDILVSGQSTNPYEYTLISRHGGSSPIFVDTQRLDEGNQFVLVP
jgi:hypothetical protein